MVDKVNTNTYVHVKHNNIYVHDEHINISTHIRKFKTNEVHMLPVLQTNELFNQQQQQMKSLQLCINTENCFLEYY